MVRFLAFLLVFVTAMALPMAHATPVDETWIPGLYDNGDSDGAILALTSLVSVAEAGAVPTPERLVPRARVEMAAGASIAPSPRLPRQDRAPPAA
jgi:hypothetical protein